MPSKTIFGARIALRSLLAGAAFFCVAFVQAQDIDHHRHDLGNFLSKRSGTKVYAASSIDSASGYFPEAIIDNDLEVEGLWRSKPGEAMPQWVIIEMPQEEELTTMMINTAHLPTEGAGPRHLLVEFSTQGPTIGYERVAREIVQQGIEEQIVSIATAKAKWVRVTLLSNWGSINYIELGRVYAYNDVEINMFEMALSNEGRLDLKDISFQSADASLSPESYPEVEMVAQILAKHPEWNVLIEGHTDSDGSYRYNMVLSEKRAQSVMKAMAEAGADPAKMKAVGFGFTKKLSTEMSEEGKALNRRVSIVIQK